MIQFTDNINEVRLHLKNGDSNLAYRRLLDCMMDTDDLNLFKQVLDFCDWMDENNDAGINQIGEKIEPLLAALNAIRIESKENENHVLSANNIGKAYKQGKFKLSPLSFDLYKGQIVGLVGENGNGKTTLLRLLAKELEPDQGELLYPFYKDKSVYDLRTNLIYIPQRIPRWYGTLMDNLHFTLSSQGIMNERNVLMAEMMIARLGLRPYKNLGWNRISSGYKTRFELAKNLLRRPQLLLLDEPLANLDILSQQTILQDIKHLSQSLTHSFGAVLSSQQLFEVEKVSDLVIFLKNGAPKYQFKNKEQNAPLAETVFELETNVDKEVLMQIFSSCAILKIVNNGGVYVGHFSAETKPSEIFDAIAKSGHDFTYVRNISHSSRRYFVNG